jgi:hypothetical protein
MRYDHALVITKCPELNMQRELNAHSCVAFMVVCHSAKGARTMKTIGETWASLLREPQGPRAGSRTRQATWYAERAPAIAMLIMDKLEGWPPGQELSTGQLGDLLWPKSEAKPRATARNARGCSTSFCCARISCRSGSVAIRNLCSATARRTLIRGGGVSPWCGEAWPGWRGSLQQRSKLPISFARWAFLSRRSRGPFAN